MEVERIVFFDGVCALCNGFANFLLKRQKLHIASFQGEHAKKYLNEKEISSLESLIYFRNGEKLKKSDAFLQIMNDLGFPWMIISFLSFIPKIIRDLIYDFLATNRYHIFGKKKECRVALPSEKKYFLD